MRIRSTCYFIIGIVLPFVILAGCDSGPNEPETVENVYVIQVEDETFRVKINDADTREIADSLAANNGTMNILGPIRSGDGGFNEPYSWHLDPDSIEFADFTIEICDGLPSFVEEELDYWLETVKTYCPWGVMVRKP